MLGKLKGGFSKNKLERKFRIVPKNRRSKKQETLYPVYVISGIRYIRFAPKNPKMDAFVTLKILRKTLYSVYVISRIRYIRFALNPVWAVSLYPVYVISGISYIRFAPKKSKGGPFCNIEKLSEKRYIRYTLYPVCAKSGIGCVIVEEDSLAPFKALKNYPRNVTSGIRYSL